MKRLWATMVCDARVQWRNGFYLVTGFMLVMWLALASLAPGLNLQQAAPVMVMANLLIGTFYFMGALVLFEKSEGTQEIQVVTPLRAGEYLFSKVLTLSLLALVENLVMTAVLTRFQVNWLALIAGTLLAAGLYSLVGYLAIVRYDSINEYLAPSIGILILCIVPLAPAFGAPDGGWYWLHPMQGPLVLLKAAVGGSSSTLGWAGLAAGLAWLGLAGWLCARAHHRFVVRKAGQGR